MRSELAPLPLLFPLLVLSGAAPVLAQAGPATGVELIRLDAENYDRVCPRGKEVDAIHGDLVLRNRELVAVIARPVQGRNANMTTRGVGGCLIDLTRREVQSDQLSAFHPGGRRFVFQQPATIDPSPVVDAAAGAGTGARSVTVTVRSEPDKGVQQTVRYTLQEDWDHLLVESEFANVGSSPVDLALLDEVRADRTFAYGVNEAAAAQWVADDWFRQTYAVQAEGHRVVRVGKGNRPFGLGYRVDGPAVRLAAGARHLLRRRVVPDATQVGAVGRVRRLAGVKVRTVTLRVADAAGPIDRAAVTVFEGAGIAGRGRTGPGEGFVFAAPEVALRARIEAIGRPPVEVAIPAAGEIDQPVRLELPGIAVGAITDAFGREVPCKVAFKGEGETATPDFGPDTGDSSVRNLVYTANGRFRRELAPGRYRVVISHGPEFDMETREVAIARGQVVTIRANLRRTVDTGGWVSTEFHSHSTPSGDNTSSTLGRVLNLLAEHLEFAPCTEHNRISTYLQQLEQLGAVARMATCSGMELTGNPGDANHQNAFPLVMKRGLQDNGAPQTDKDPIAQIERLALWDDHSEKLVQSNHPRFERIVGDRNLDGKPDGGYRRMMSFMDVVEVHPPHLIFQGVKPEAPGKAFNNRMFRWLQSLNAGYRVPGVVNTDAHYNFHGSGWLRNYVKSPTDDPARIKTLDIVRACESGHIVMTNGPFLEVELRSGSARGIPGDDLRVAAGEAELHVRVQCANWLDINRVQVFLNGRAAPEHDYRRKTHPELFGDAVVKFDQRLRVAFAADAHLIVAVIGEGLTLGPVYDVPHGRDRPVAVSNPIFVDVGGDGFTPNRDLLGVPLPGHGSGR